MQYERLTTQPIWEKKARKEVKVIRREQAKESFKQFFLFVTCMALMGFAFWCYWTHQTWLPEVTTQFNDFLQKAPEKVVNSSLMTQVKNL